MDGDVRKVHGARIPDTPLTGKDGKRVQRESRI